MADRRFTTHSDTKSTSTHKHSIQNHSKTVHDDSSNPNPAINASLLAAAAMTPGNPATGERRLSVYRRLSMSNGSRKSSMMILPNQVRPNTYRMAPEKDHRFQPYRLQPKILDILADHLKDKSYKTINASEMSKDLSRDVLQTVKNFPIQRYKLLVQTVITEKAGQLIRFASRCLWDPKTDNMFSVNYETKDMFVIVTVYGIYLD